MNLYRAIRDAIILNNVDAMNLYRATHPALYSEALESVYCYANDI